MATGFAPTVEATAGAQPAWQETRMMDELNKNRPHRPGQAELTPSTDDEAAKRREREAKRKEKLDEQLDTGLEETFPGSDPVAVTQPPHSTYDKRRH